MPRHSHSHVGVAGGHAAAAANQARYPIGYRGPQVCALIGITYRQLDYWARTDLLRPSINEAHGQGTQRRYSYRDLVELAVIRRLLDAGISLQSVRRAITHLRDQAGDDITAANLVLAGDQTVIARNGDEIVALLKNGHGVLNILPLGDVLADLNAALADLEPAGAR